MKGIWDILNSIVRNNSKQKGYPEYFTDNYNKKYNVNNVANNFNQFFVNVGPDLAGKIPDPGTTGEHQDDVLERNSCSMFIKPVDERDIRYCSKMYSIY